MKLIESIKKDLNLTEVFKGSSIAMVYKVAGAGIGYVFFWVISRLYGADLVGIFSLCWTILLFLSILGKAGMDSSIVRFIASFLGRGEGKSIMHIYRRGLSIVLIFSIVAALLLMLFRHPLGRLFFETENSAWLLSIVAMALVPFSILTFSSEALRGLKKIGYYSLLQNGSVYLSILIIILIMWLSGFNNDYVLQSLVISISLIAFGSMMLYRTIEKNSLRNLIQNDNVEIIPYRRILNISFPMMIGNALFILLNWTDILVLGIYRTDADVGIYNIAVKIAALNSIVLAAINTIAAPKFAEIFNTGKRSGFRRMVKQIAMINTLLSLPVFIIILIFPQQLLVLFGPEYAAGKSALMFLAVAHFSNAICGSTMYVMNMSGMEKTGRNIMIVSALINVSLNFLLIPRHGLMGGAIATLSSVLIWNAISVISIYRKHGFYTFPFRIGKNTDQD